MPKRPICKLCGKPHWSHEEHVWSGTTPTETSVASASREAGVSAGMSRRRRGSNTTSGGAPSAKSKRESSADEGGSISPAERTKRWKEANAEKYRERMREYMREYRARKARESEEDE